MTVRKYYVYTVNNKFVGCFNTLEKIARRFMFEFEINDISNLMYNCVLHYTLEQLQQATIDEWIIYECKNTYS